MNAKNEHVWQEVANTFRPGTTAAQRGILPPGLYQFDQNDHGWWLTRTNPRFEFPYKVYGTHKPIVSRVTTAWARLAGNLGVLLNGVKGTGKTVTAQMLANWAVDEGYPVLVVGRPIPLKEVMESVVQPLVVIFDEFEKTHSAKDAAEGSDGSQQQQLLTAIDGMSRSEHRRLFIFTTNSRKIDENFIDRPSRIRYHWEFGRLTDDVIDELMADLLDPSLRHLSSAVSVYLATRAVLSIDVVKTVLNEVNTFREAPEAFAAILNLTEQDAHGYIVEVLDTAGKVTKTLAEHFTPHGPLMRTMLTRGGRAEAIDLIRRQNGWSFYDSVLSFNVMQETKDLNVWACHVQVSAWDTWVKRFKKVEESMPNSRLWVDAKPDGWEIPRWAKLIQDGMPLSDKDEADKDEWEESGTVYGGTEKQLVLLRITPNFEPRMSGHWGNIAL